MYGRVTKYFTDRGYGFIRGEDHNSYFVHHSQLNGEHMTLQESEVKLSELNTDIDKLLKEREVVLKEWYAAFNRESRKYCL